MADALSAQLQQLLPASIGAVVSTTPPAADCTLLAAEHLASAPMQPGRRREFAHGRQCARQALVQLGETAPDIPVGADREPVWPGHIVGSISHSGDLAAAIVARRCYYGGLGIDFEADIPLDQETLGLIGTQAEIDWLAESANPLNDAKLLFSAKESVYKCIWPQVRRFVDFPEVTLHINRMTGQFQACSNNQDLPAGLLAEVRGRFHVGHGWIVTIASLPPQT